MRHRLTSPHTQRQLGVVGGHQPGPAGSQPVAQRLLVSTVHTSSGSRRRRANAGDAEPGQPVVGDDQVGARTPVAPAREQLGEPHPDPRGATGAGDRPRPATARPAGRAPPRRPSRGPPGRRGRRAGGEIRPRRRPSTSTAPPRRPRPRARGASSNLRSMWARARPASAVSSVVVAPERRRSCVDGVVGDHERAVGAARHVELDVVDAQRERASSASRCSRGPGPAGAHRWALTRTGGVATSHDAVRRGRAHQPGEQADVGGRLGVPLHRRRRTGRPAASMASSVPSVGVRRRAAKPGWRRTDWWWWQFTRRARRRPARRPGVPGAVRDLDRAERVAAGAVLARGRPGRARAGRARRRRAPPSPACRGRRPSTAGRPPRRRRAGRPPRRRGRGASSAVRGCAVRAVAPRVDVGAAGDHQPVEPGHDRVGGARRSRGAAAAPARRRARLDRLGVLRGQQVGALVPHPPGRVLAVGGQPDERSGHRQSGVT